MRRTGNSSSIWSEAPPRQTARFVDGERTQMPFMSTIGELGRDRHHTGRPSATLARNALVTVHNDDGLTDAIIVDGREAQIAMMLATIACAKCLRIREIGRDFTCSHG